MDHARFYDSLVLREDQFDHPSRLHGIGHTYRVMVHVYRLANGLHRSDLLLPGLAAAYLHDMARRHDGYCDQHGRWSAESKLPEYRPFFLEHGIKDQEMDFIAVALENHSRMEELDISDPAYDLAAVLKDADALDRIRLGDHNLNTKYLRYPESIGMIAFARDLYFSSRNLNFYNFTAILEYANSINQK